MFIVLSTESFYFGYGAIVISGGLSAFNAIKNLRVLPETVFARKAGFCLRTAVFGQHSQNEKKIDVVPE
jgi:hypothetical protein